MSEGKLKHLNKRRVNQIIVQYCQEEAEVLKLKEQVVHSLISKWAF